MLTSSAISGTSDNQKSSLGGSPAQSFFKDPLFFKSKNSSQRKTDTGAEEIFTMSDRLVNDQLFFKPAVSCIQRSCLTCEEEENKWQRKENGTETMAPPATINYLNVKSAGNAMNENERNFFEPRMGYDFWNVRLHTDKEANESARSINALAYTHENNIVFAPGQYDPQTDSGKKLLAHELSHVIQQNAGIGTKKIQRLYRFNELSQNGAPVVSNPVSSNPDVSFYQGSAVNTANRKALVIAGIHGSEPSARALGLEIKNQLDAGIAHADFHTILVPQVNPAPTSSRSAGSGTTQVTDLNREFGTGYSSPNPLANKVTQIVTEFDPERVMSIHAISRPSLGGVFLDPVNSGTFPATATPQQRAQAFTGDQRNLEAMQLADSMIGAIGNTASTRGNTPTSERPPSHYPGAGTGSSPSSLIYPLQDTISPTGHTSLGVWVSGLGKPIITIEIPGYNAPAPVWRSFLPAVWEFLRIRPAVATPTGATPGTTGRSPASDSQRIIEDLRGLRQRLSEIPAPLPTEARPAALDASCLTFASRADLNARKAHWGGVISSLPVPDLVNWIVGISLPSGSGAAIAESVMQKDCMLSALSMSARAGGSPIQLSGTPRAVSGFRDFADQRRIWHRKFEFDSRLGLFDRISPQARTVCGGLLLPSEVKWNTTSATHRRCWGVAPLAGTRVPVFPAGTRSLTDDEKQFEILEASSAPGISRHHWGTDFDLFSDEPAQWETAGRGSNFGDEYRWLLGNASMYGFIQAFTPLSAFGQLGYMEERWHWSYWPVAQAMLELVTTHQADVQTALTTQWGAAGEFSFIRNHWTEFMNNVNQTPTP